MLETENENIHLKKNKKTGEYSFKNLAKIKITSISEFLKYMHLAYYHRNYHYFQYENSNINNRKNKPKGLYHFSRSHIFCNIKLNMRQKQLKKRRKSRLVFIDCASYPKISIHENLMQNTPENEVNRRDFEFINNSFIQLNALMTRMQKKADLSIDMRESKLNQCLYPVRIPDNAHMRSKLLLFINCTHLKHYRVQYKHTHFCMQLHTIIGGYFDFTEIW